MLGRSSQLSSEGIEVKVAQGNVQRVLNESDIEGFLEIGAPPDEYSREAQNITSKLAYLNDSDLTEENVIAAVRDVWIQSFGPFSEGDLTQRLPVFQQVAQRILSSR
jgi:hypothetical protein